MILNKRYAEAKSDWNAGFESLHVNNGELLFEWEVSPTGFVLCASCFLLNLQVSPWNAEAELH